MESSEKPIDYYYSSEFLEQILPNSDYRNLFYGDNQNLNLLFTLIEKRFLDLEDKVYQKKQKNSANKIQKLLLLKHLGMLKIILDLKISLKSKAYLLSLIIDSSEDNIKKDLSLINYDEAPGINTVQNLEFLLNAFTTAKHDDAIKSIKDLLAKAKGHKKK